MAPPVITQVVEPLTPAGLQVGEAEVADWEAYLESHPQATSCHLWGWRQVIEKTFGHQTRYLLARRGEEVAGVLPLVMMKSALFGRFFSSLPYLNYGGLLTSAPEAEEALLSQAIGLAGDGRASSLELRHIEPRRAPPHLKQHKVTMLLDLPGDEDAQWKAFDPKLRNQIRKSQRSGLTAALDPAGGLDDFYAVFSRNMRDLGTPVYPRKFFQTILEVFPDQAHLLVVRLGSRAVAAGLLFAFRDRVEIPWASSIRNYNPLCPNNLLYWESIRFAVRSRCRIFDMGRSSPGEGTFRFKEQWGARAVRLHWQYWLAEGETLPERNPHNPKFRALISLWKMLPLRLAGTLGPHIARSLP